MIYVDASVFVAALSPEVGTERVGTWLARQRPGALCLSGWVETEVSSAFARKVRMRLLGEDQRAGALYEFRALVSHSVIGIPVPAEAFGRAAQLIETPGSKLRAGDALHLAIASLGGHGLATFDHRLAEAAASAGVVVERVA